MTIVLQICPAVIVWFKVDLETMTGVLRTRASESHIQTYFQEREGWREVLKSLVGGVRPASSNPDPISDLNNCAVFQHSPFSELDSNIHTWPQLFKGRIGWIRFSYTPKLSYG